MTYKLKNVPPYIVTNIFEITVITVFCTSYANLCLYIVWVRASVRAYVCMRVCVEEEQIDMYTTLSTYFEYKTILMMFRSFFRALFVKLTSKKN